ncbi:MAG: GGDEF domain-containing protein [Clostridia bacterium]|nr:GGDEF domain-containing protein [Clostridia bacterium]
MLMFRSFSFGRLVNDDYRLHVQMIVVPIIAGAVSFGMFVLNIYTHKTILMYSTLLYAVLSFTNAFFEYRCKKMCAPAVAMFTFTTILLFTSFLIYGGTEGFSPIWICALPLCVLLMTGRKKGSLICAVMFIIIVFLLWTPVGGRVLQFEYTNSFLERFPLVYIAIFLVGFFFEAIREATYNSLIKLQKQYKELSTKDTLTAVYNRYWFNESFADILRRPDDRPIALLIIDIDDFKKFNDEHGHLFGDKVLRVIACILKEKTKDIGSVCRWGGEEFAVLMERCDALKMADRAELLRSIIAQTSVEDDNGNIANTTISVGAVCLNHNNGIALDQLVSLADEALYKAKTDGRNCVRILNIA